MACQSICIFWELNVVCSCAEKKNCVYAVVTGDSTTIKKHVSTTFSFREIFIETFFVEVKINTIFRSIVELKENKEKKIEEEEEIKLKDVGWM